MTKFRNREQITEENSEQKTEDQSQRGILNDDKSVNMLLRLEFLNLYAHTCTEKRCHKLGSE
jgi:hypothetical protein